MNAKKKLKKKRYINSGMVSRSAEIRACTCLPGAGCIKYPAPNTAFQQMGQYVRDPERDGYAGSLRRLSAAEAGARVRRRRDGCSEGSVALQKYLAAVALDCCVIKICA